MLLGRLLPLLSATVFATAQRPNIVLIVVDDLGYHNIDAPPHFVNSELHTPAFTKLAQEGVVLSNYYAFRYCGPSRASILTGRLPGHGVSEAMFSLSRSDGYNVNLTMLPAKLKQAGYATHALGKWHCGFYQRKFLPTSRGFDTFTGYLGGSEDHFDQTSGDTCNGVHYKGTDLWQDLGDGPAGGGPALGLNGSYSAYTYTALAVDIILRSPEGGQPFFLYFAMQNVHGPLQADQRFYDLQTADDERRSKMNAMVSAADESLANVSAALDAAGLTQDTLMIVVSDNGGPILEPSKRPGAGNNYPLRGGKYGDYEGGIKVVSMLRYPRLLSERAGQIWPGLMHAVDWYPTLCNLAGIDSDDTAPGRVHIDGYDVLGAIAAGDSSPRSELLLGNRGGTHGMYRKGDMKIIVGTQGVYLWVGPVYPNATTPEKFHVPKRKCNPCLYDLQRDPSEDVDLAASQPDLAGSMLARYHELARDLTAPNGPPSSEMSHPPTDPKGCAAMVAAGGWWVPWGDNTVSAVTVV